MVKLIHNIHFVVGNLNYNESIMHQAMFLHDNRQQFQLILHFSETRPYWNMQVSYRCTTQFRSIHTSPSSKRTSTVTGDLSIGLHRRGDPAYIPQKFSSPESSLSAIINFNSKQISGLIPFGIHTDYYATLPIHPHKFFFYVYSSKLSIIDCVANHPTFPNVTV